MVNAKSAEGEKYSKSDGAISQQSTNLRRRMFNNECSPFLWTQYLKVSTKILNFVRNGIKMQTKKVKKLIVDFGKLISRRY